MSRPIVLRDSPATQRFFELLVASAQRVGAVHADGRVIFLTPPQDRKTA